MIAVTPSQRSSSAPVLLPVAFALSLVLAVWLRYGGRTSDSDTATITQAIRGVLDQDVARPGGGLAYTNGFSYPVLVAALTDITGLSFAVIQTIILPWLLVVVAVVAFVTFRAIAGSARAGAISALLLLVQPDFLFVTQRGSHEKVTWLLVLLLVYSLVSTFRRPEPRQVGPFILVFYLCGFALICTNAFFGSSFVASVFLVLLGTSLVGRVMLRDSVARRVPLRFFYPLITLGCFSFLFIYHIYPVAQHGLRNLDNTVQRVSALYLSSELGTSTDSNADANAEVAAVSGDGSEVSGTDTPSAQRPTPVSPYATIAGSWISIRVYVLITAFTWLLIAGAVLIWFLTAARFFRRGVFQPELPLFVAWAFAAATALQIALSILGDTTGTLGANVQLRLFPSFALFAVPLVVTAPSIRHRVLPATTARWLVPTSWLVILVAVAVTFPIVPVLVVVPVAALLVVWFRFRPLGNRGWLPRTVAVSIFVFFTLAALLKATNDPLVSNKWTFYSAAEFRGLVWADRRLPATTLVWSEFDERLATVARAYVGEAPVANGPRRWTAGSSWESEQVRYALVSDITAARASRLAVPLPGSELDDRIYDNGRVQVVHWTPDTPYQP